MASCRYKRLTELLVVLLAATPLLVAPADSLAAFRFQPTADRSSLLPFASLYSDFDGDAQPDCAELDAKRDIRLTFSNSAATQLHFESNAWDRGRLLAGDIDRDNDADLIWISLAQPESIAVWTGDGKGHFEAAPDARRYGTGIGRLLGLDAFARISIGAVAQRRVPVVPASAVVSEGSQALVLVETAPGQFRFIY
jgi:hypothetical protein